MRMNVGMDDASAAIRARALGADDSLHVQELVQATNQHHREQRRKSTESLRNRRMR